MSQVQRRPKGQLIAKNERLRRRNKPLLKRVAASRLIKAKRTTRSQEGKDLRAALLEAEQQQAATSEILRVISGSPADLQPVFDTILLHAIRLCQGSAAVLWQYDGSRLNFAASRLAKPRNGPTHPGTDYLRKNPLPLGKYNPTPQAALEKRTVHVEDVFANRKYRPLIPKDSFGTLPNAGTVLAVPLLRQEELFGVISIWRFEKRPFSRQQIEMVETFAAQAVIAIQNVRLFRELQTRNKDLTEALEQQTATGEILKVISSSATDVQPVFETIVRNAVRLGNAAVGFLISYDGTTMKLAAQYNVNPQEDSIYRPAFPRPAARDTMTGRSIVDRTVINLADIAASDFGAGTKERARRAGYRSALIVPMLRGGVPIGTLNIQRREAGAFPDSYVALLKTFADQAVIAIENVRLFNETKEALERQTATAEILASMSGSMTDTKPVFDAIVHNLLRLFGTGWAVVALRRGEIFELAGFKGEPGFEHLPDVYPLPVDARTIIGETAVAQQVKQYAPVIGNPAVPRRTEELARRFGFNSIMAAPMLWKGEAIGVILTARRGVLPFDDKQVRLIKSFADQAVIAIENVRLFNETKESLEQQTAISDVLRVISSSPIDVGPVLDAVARRAAKICEATDARIFMLEGEELRHRAGFGDLPLSAEVLPLTRGVTVGRAVVDGAPVHIGDIEAEPEDEYPLGREVARKAGWRTSLAVPLMRERRALGGIVLRRREVRPFSEKQIALLKTFADQAAIAIENARLFNETREALERQTATAAVLRVISGSPNHLAPVFAAILEHATRLCEAEFGFMFTSDGQGFDPVAQRGLDAAKYAAWSDQFRRYRVPGPLSGLGRVLAKKAPVLIADIADDEAYRARDPLRVLTVEAIGARTFLAVPLLKESAVIGALVIYRREVRPFSQKQVMLLQTFADQAVIAIENVRLFKELQERTEALTKSVGQLTALGEVGRAVSSTLELETVLKTIVSRAVQLTGLDGGSIFEYDERAQVFTMQASENMPEELFEITRSSPIRLGDGAIGRTGLTREPTQFPDIRDESYQSERKELLLRAGYRAVLAVPLLREDHLVGALFVNRKTPGPFAPEVVELLKTFATQSAMAIQNARLFREVEEKGKQLEVASEHKSQFLASMSHELRTPLNAILGFNEMMLDGLCGEVPAGFKDPLDETQKSGKHLLRLINNVLDLAKIEAGRMELALADYSVHDTVERVRSTLRPLAAEKGLEFLANVPADIPFAYGDAGRITQCLMNLAGNSLKFTKEGSVEISVQQQNGQLRYCVADTGIGIPPERIGSLFTEFKQTDATIASEYGGTGLGLSITKKFIEMHGGRIWVESEVGKGSTFIFEIPLKLGK